MASIEHAEDALIRSAGWLTSRRWYGDKSRSMISMTPETLVPVTLGKEHGIMAILHFAYEQGEDSKYFAPMMLNSGDRHPGDALGNVEFMRWFLAGFAEDRTIAGGWRWHHLSGSVPDSAGIPPEGFKVIAAEQSNTSVVIDQQWIVKVFRKLQSGVNPDLEIGEFLSANGRFRHIPALYGRVDVENQEQITTIAALQEFVPNQGDGWSWLLSALASLDAQSAAALVEDVALLGNRTAELHLALASDPADDAFAPEPMTPDDAEATIRRVVAEMEQSVEELAKRLPPSEVEQLHKELGQLMGGAWALVGSMKTRVHGDYHLGQVLRTLDNDFCLIDFEGEPSRPMSQRREKQTPLKDVAGMLRSLDYAAAVAKAGTDNADRRTAIDRWLGDASKAFQSAYRGTIMASSTRLMPDDPETFKAGLDVMIAEKALYEVRYELDNRPDWLPIPLNGIRRLAGVPVQDVD